MPYMRIEVRFHPTKANIVLPRPARLMHIILPFQYAVVIRPFTSVTGIELDGANEKIIQEQPVEIGTLYGPGPVPKRYVPL